MFKEILANLDSMSLIHGKSAEIRKSLEVAEGHFQIIADKLQQATEVYTAVATIAGAKRIQELESEHAQCLAIRDKLRGN